MNVDLNVKDKKFTVIEKREMLIFFIVTFGVAFLVGIPVYFIEYIKPGTLAFFMTILPSAGVSIAKVFSRKVYNTKTDNEKNLFHYIIIGNFSFYITLIALRVLGIIDKDMVDGSIQFSSCIISILLILYVFMEGKDLYPFKNSENAKIPMVIFLVTFTICGFIMTSQKNIFIPQIIMVIITSPATFAMSSIFFFGEEYGWRGFWQGKLQMKFGKRIGVILLGVLWELWHIPLSITYYNVDILGWMIRIIYVTSLAIFLGYIYMKTKNVWLCALIHLINNSINSMEGLYHVSTGFNMSNMSSNYIAGILILSLVFSLFIFTKEYENN